MTDLIIDANQSAMQLLQTSSTLRPPTFIKSSISCEPIDTKLKGKQHFNPEIEANLSVNYSTYIEI